MSITVIGGGSWGTALGVLLAKKGLEVKLWSRRSELAGEINGARENQRYLPGVVIPAGITASADLEEALAGTRAVVLGVPSHGLREMVQTIAPLMGDSRLIVNTAKGLEEGSFLRLSQVIEEELGEKHRVVALSGPSHAEEVARDIPTAIVVAGRNRQAAEEAQDLFMTPKFRVYTNPDLVGVELGGALKNVIALCCGVSDGLGFGDNTKAALMTRGLAEITRLGVEMGAQALTFAGLAGVGDLIVTCTSMHSRNRRAGIEIGKGKTVEEAMASVQMVVEGVRTTKAARGLAQGQGIEMPIIEQAYRVLFEGANPKEAVVKLMTRGKTHEMEEVALNSSTVW
ncbi:MAG: NAD(P)H-dependent glycerol-3-phosphate dehydrogenase [Clostridia bacterium]|nr:NAD(P)H-dependent glycerol-3-phosphate dehydrogenase [Clostridia bacterium]